MNRDPRKNGSGCKDPTAYDAIKTITAEERILNRRVKDTIKSVKKLIDLMGFDVIGRIKIRDKKTGKEFR